MNIGIEKLSWTEISLRLGLAFGAGALLGWERQSHGRAAGLRTTILACVSSTLAMIVSDLMFQESSAVTTTGVWRPDPARMAQGILTGIGFLGAGTILRAGPNIRGVTTAASLWFATVLGLAFGNGHHMLGVIGTGLAMITLHLLPRLEGGIQVDWYATLTIRTDLEGMDQKELRQQIERLDVKIKTLKLSIDHARKEKTVVCEIKLLKSRRFDAAGDMLPNFLNAQAS